jgi:hypothetical protein
MENYVTLFDSYFIPQGIALHKSMVRNIINFKLWILCMDEESFEFLKKINLPMVEILNLKDFENEELLSIKKKRKINEYCWTLTPFLPDFVFSMDSTLERVTYIDADLWFLKDPKEIFQEFEKSYKNILITSHSYNAKYDQTNKSGRFCVQFIIFNKYKSQYIRDWWKSKCIEWCFDYYEDGKLGDQKYLDSWPNLFCDDVHILEQKNFALAPWNCQVYPYGEAVFFHFQGLRISSKTTISIGLYEFPQVVIENLYLPYFRDLKSCIELMCENNFRFIVQADRITIFKKIKNILYLMKYFITEKFRSGELKF